MSSDPMAAFQTLADECRAAERSAEDAILEAAERAERLARLDNRPTAEMAERVPALRSRRGGAA